MVDFQSATLTLLAVIGAVNVISFFKPGLDSRVKFAVSLLVAFAVGFVPAEFGDIILQHAKDAITVALAASGSYKLFQKAGGQ